MFEGRPFFFRTSLLFSLSPPPSFQKTGLDPFSPPPLDSFLPGAIVFFDSFPSLFR